ncbi:MAG: hypothetical protein J0I06_25225 [Planctomycetes bacterium]|nr:hypothetical protein [Planctomycetota bacterium]
MSSRRLLGRAAAFAVVAPLALFWSTPAAAQQPADQVTIDQSIERGVKFLRKEQKPAGYWGTGANPRENNGIGYTALTGLTLVECGVPTSDPGLKRAANIVRAAAGDLDSTYELTLAILFLDRMKDKVDTRVIQLLAGRLISAQMPSGGWGYKTHKYPEPSVLKLLDALRKLSSPGADGTKPDADKLRKGLPEDMRRLSVWDDTSGRLPADPPAIKDRDKRHDLYDAITDNSNTHFAMLGLWAARKYNIPVDRTFALVQRRFRTSQGPGGTWNYDFHRTGADGGNQFTCIALLGVAIGHVVSPPEGVKPETDPVILNAFVALSKAVGDPVGDINNRPKIKDAAPGGLYFLWTMERIAVLYDLQKLNKKDWYLWGAEILVGNQSGADGSWDQECGYPGQSPIINTCLALLFLKRANLTPDLGQKLKVDTSTLTAKVDDKISPKVEPPPPSPKIEEPPPTPKKEEPPPKKEEPKKEEPKPVAAPAPAPEPEASPPKKSPWPLIILGMLVAGVVGGGLAFFVVKNRQKGDEDEDEKPKKKKKSKGAAGSGKAAKPEKSEAAKKTTGAKKVKQDVEVDEDD